MAFDIRKVTRVGCKRDARKALKGLLPLACQPSATNPRGSRGAFRTVYAAGDVVYKVCDGPWAGIDDDTANRDELATVTRVRTSPTGQMYVTPATGWIIDGVMVVAQPRLRVTFRDALDQGMVPARVLYQARDEIEDVANELGIADMHGRNWMLDDQGRPWIVDANMAAR